MKQKIKKTWRLIYPDKTEDLTNFNPLEFERQKILKEFSERLKEELDKPYPKGFVNDCVYRNWLLRKIDKIKKEMGERNKNYP